MRKLIVILIVLMAVPAMAVPTFEFSPGSGTGTAGGWSYDGATTISFAQDVLIDLVNGATGDGLVGATVFIPTFTIGGIPGAPYTLSGGSFSVMDPTATTVWMTATLGVADLVPAGTTGVGYTAFQSDLTGIAVTAAGALASAELAYWAAASISVADFELSLQGARPDFVTMLETGTPGGNGFSGAVTVPAPGAMVLGSIGVSFVGWLRRRKSL